MLQVARLTVAHGASTADSPSSLDFTVPVGQGIKFYVKLPGVSSGEIGFRLLDHDARFAPAPGSNQPWIVNDQTAPEVVEWEEDHEFRGRQAEITIEAYNTSGADADVEVRAVLLSQAEVSRLADAVEQLVGILPGLRAAVPRPTGAEPIEQKA